LTRYWFISPKYRRDARFALFASALAFLVILLGAYTRLTDAGLSCPDWPHCYGFITAPHTSSQLETAAKNFPLIPINVKKAWTEMTHRYFAGTEGILIVILAFSILFTRKAHHTKGIFIAVLLLALLSTQVMLGMLTVTEKLKPLIVVGHLLNGISLLGLLWWAYLDLHLHDNFFIHKSTPAIIPWLWLALLIIIAQITLGGWVSTHYAGLACIDFPYCNGQVFPALHLDKINSDLITIHMLHRIGATITATYTALLALFLLKNSSFRSIAILLLGLIALQFALGILNIIWLRPVWIALAHQMVAVILLLTMITSLVKAYFESRDYRYGSWLS
jgi:cytochrome c oxidase assembly protein subunit 15